MPEESVGEKMQGGVEQTPETTLASGDQAEQEAPREPEGLREALVERERRIVALEAELAEGRKALAQAQREQEALQAELSLALGKYRASLLAGAPEVPEELVQGESVADVDASFRQAKGLVERVRQQVEATLNRERVPAGAPLRRAADTSALPPAEKIALGLRQMRGA